MQSPIAARSMNPSPAGGTLPQTVRRDFSTIDCAEAMRRAREIVPVLRERAQRSEDARILIRENEQLLHETGLFRFHQPKAFGGMELPFVAVVDIPADSRVAASRRRGMSATSAAITGSSAITIRRPSAKCGTPIRMH